MVICVWKQLLYTFNFSLLLCFYWGDLFSFQISFICKEPFDESHENLQFLQRVEENTASTRLSLLVKSRMHAHRIIIHLRWSGLKNIWGGAHAFVSVWFNIVLTEKYMCQWGAIWRRLLCFGLPRISNFSI